MRNVNETADESVNKAIKERLKEMYNVGKYDSKKNARMREENERKSYSSGVKATTLNKLKREADVNVQQKKRAEAEAHSHNVNNYNKIASMREESKRIGTRDGVLATFRNRYKLRQERLDAEIEKQKDPSYRRATENVERLEREARPKASMGYYDVSKDKLKKRKIKR